MPDSFEGEQVDTTMLSLNQLQEFCVNTYTELNKVQTETQQLVLERNKIKTWIEVAINQLTGAKNNTQNKESLLLDEEITHCPNLLQGFNRKHNVYNEITEKCLEQILGGLDQANFLTRNNQERNNEMQQDINNKRADILEGDLDEEIARVALQMQFVNNQFSICEEFERKDKLQRVNHKQTYKENVQFITDTNVKKQQTFNDYKLKTIQEFLRINENPMLNLHLYYEKIRKQNNLMFEDLIEKYKRSKSNIKDLEEITEQKKLHLEITQKELHDVADKEKELADSLVNIKCTQSEAKELKKKKDLKKDQFDYLFWDSILLEETLNMKNQCIEKVADHLDNDFFKAQERFSEQFILMENLECKLRAQIEMIDHIIQFSNSKQRFLGSRLTSRDVVKIAFDELEETYKKENKGRT